MYTKNDGGLLSSDILNSSIFLSPNAKDDWVF